MNDDGDVADGRGGETRCPGPSDGRSVFAADAPEPARPQPAAEPLPEPAPRCSTVPRSASTRRSPSRTGARPSPVPCSPWRPCRGGPRLAGGEHHGRARPPDRGDHLEHDGRGGRPTVEAAMALVPDVVTTCAAPGAQPDDEPGGSSLQCPLDGVPEALAFVLYATDDERDAAFDAVVDEFAVPTSGADCALGQMGAPRLHRGRAGRPGRVSCRRRTGRLRLDHRRRAAAGAVRRGRALRRPLRLLVPAGRPDRRRVPAPGRAGPARPAARRRRGSGAGGIWGWPSTSRASPCGASLPTIGSTWSRRSSSAKPTP